jgi:hypothetical protein
MIKLEGEEAQKRIFDAVIEAAKGKGVETDGVVWVVWDAKKNNTPPRTSLFVLWLSDAEQRWALSEYTVIATLPESPEPPKSAKRRLYVRDYAGFVSAALFVREERREDAARFLGKLEVSI